MDEVRDHYAVSQWRILMASPDTPSSLEEGAFVLSQWADLTVDIAELRRCVGVSGVGDQTQQADSM